MENSNLEKLKFSEIVQLLLNGDSQGINDLVNQELVKSLKVKYTDVNINTGETSSEYRMVKLSGLKVGIQNKADNVDSSDQSSGALVTLSEVESIAYPLVTEINKLIDIILQQNNLISDLDTRVTALEKAGPTPTPPVSPVTTGDI